MKKNFPILGYFFASVIVIAFFAKSLDVLVDRTDPVPTPTIESKCETTPPGEDYRCNCFEELCIWMQI